MTSDKVSSLVRDAPFLALLAVVVACHFVHARAYTPAVIWCPHESADYDAVYRTPLSPLQKLKSKDFESILAQFNVTKPVLVSEELCVEDLRNSKVLSNATNGSKIFYFPCVIAPDMAFEKVYKQIRIIEDINDDHELNAVLKDIDSNGCIALAGKQCRYSYAERIKRDVVDADNSTEFKIKTDRVLLYSANPPLFKTGDMEKEVRLEQSKVSKATSRVNNNTVIMTITFSNIEHIGNLMLEFFFQIKSLGYYTLNIVRYDAANVDLITKRDITFPFNFSYHCTPETVFANDTTFLSISDMQIQVEHKNATFDDAYDCVGFTSIPIWTGIFVTLILGLIMIWALTMIMDIRTMDRFDDPKGKTITISTAE